MYREGQHEDALGLYTEALALAKTKAQKIAVHSNRAACYLKLHDFKKAAEECTSVLELDHQHSGALMLRVQTLVTLKDYQSALFDVNRLMELNPSSDVYQNMQARLRTQLSLAPIPESEEEALYHEEGGKSPLTGDAKSKPLSSKPEMPVTQNQNLVVPSDMPSKPKGWEAIPKPKGHSGLDYSRWDRVVDDSSEEEEEVEEEQQPQYRFCVKTVGVRPVQ
uniref:Protein unc-45 homolog A n=1 Tax=Elaeis guineensis var. tenera TaxID=51953 RepID=A0A6I9QHP5_ELAGV|nr:protein unc-45 homolog A [Elaeis guineensis]